MNTKKIWAGIFAGAVLSVFSACLAPVGNGVGLDDEGKIIPPTPPDTNLTFVYNKVFSKKCTGCHGAQPTGDAMNLSSSVSSARDALFPGGNPRLSYEESGTQPRWRILPNEPDSSYLLQKVSTATPKFGSRMPQGGQLTADEIKIIRRWIEKGAPLE
jgi:hypothetical protein